MQFPLERAAVVATAFAAAGTLAGCVERKMMIRSDPPGAMISLDGEDTGRRTPAEIPFDFGGTRIVTLTAPGHRVKETTAELHDPWFTYFPLDVFAEFVWPLTIEDEQTFAYVLEPYAPGIDPETKTRLLQKLAELKLRAEEYRAGGSEGPGRVVEPPPPPAPK